MDMNRFPLDLLEVIFNHFAEQLDQLLNLRRVCRRWRAVVDKFQYVRKLEVGFR